MQIENLDSKFKCPICGDTQLYLIQTMTTSTEISDHEGKVIVINRKHFDSGKEEIIDADKPTMRCSNGHYLVLSQGNPVSDLQELRKWLKEREDEKAVKEEHPVNTFGLYFIGNYESSKKNLKKVVEISDRLTVIMDKLIKDMKDNSERREYYEFINPVADEIRAFSYSGVGVGDTETDEAICHYLEMELKRFFGKERLSELLKDFYDLIHS